MPDVGRLKVTSWWYVLQQDRLPAIIFEKNLVKVGKFLVDCYSASSRCSMFELIQEAMKQAMHKLGLWTVISRRWQLAEGQRASQEWYTNFVVVCLGKRKLKNKHAQPTNKTKETFVFPNVLLLRTSGMSYSWTGISSPTLWGKNSPYCFLVVSGLQILCFHTLTSRLIGLIILCLGRFLWAVEAYINDWLEDKAASFLSRGCCSEPKSRVFSSSSCPEGDGSIAQSHQ